MSNLNLRSIVYFYPFPYICHLIKKKNLNSIIPIYPVAGGPGGGGIGGWAPNPGAPVGEACPVEGG